MALGAKLKLKFKRPGKDSLKLALMLDGAIPWTELAGQRVTLDVGGVKSEFLLDSTGRGRIPGGKIAVGSDAYRTFLVVKRKRGYFAQAWAAHGLLNQTGFDFVTLPIQVMIGDRKFAGEMELIYKAKQGKGGKAVY